MDASLRDRILAANVALHTAEAALYDRIHPELTHLGERLRLERLIAAAVKALPGDAPCRALDVGAGTGFVAARLLEWGYQVTALDISAAMIARFKAKHAAALREGRLRLAVEDADTYLLTHDERYALITASSVLHHLPDYGATLALLADRLVPGGSLLLFHEPAGGAPSRLERFLRRADWKLARAFVISWDDLQALRHVNLDYEMADYHEKHGFDEDAVRAALKRANLTVTAFERYATAQTGAVRWLLRAFFPPRTWSLVARKPRG